MEIYVCACLGANAHIGLHICAHMCWSVCKAAGGVIKTVVALYHHFYCLLSNECNDACGDMKKI